MFDEIDQFHHYLVAVCGLAPNTCARRLPIVRAFLVRHFGDERIEFAKLKATDIDDFILAYATRWAPESLKGVRSSLRSYLRYRSIKGDRTESLSTGLPVLANWKSASLPKALNDEQLALFTKAFDLSRNTGVRDYAIARCLIDLGLRGHEVAQLRLESLNWRDGIVTISGSKGRHVRQLPLPPHTGAAIANYLKNARPQTKLRFLFFRHCAPIGRPLSVAGIRNTMRRAFDRCGLGDQFCNTHVFRHTLAVRMQQSGASLKEIADVLRHKSLESTTIYAKVDLKSLGALALPWPGRQK